MTARSPGRVKGQILVSTVLIIGLMIMVILVTAFQTHSLFLRTRGLVVREVVAAITADFKRALATTLAVATRAYFNYSEFAPMLDRYSQFGISLYNRHNFTVARIAALIYLEYWRQSIMKTYGEYGVQVSYELLQLDLSRDLDRPRNVQDLMKGYWYMPTSGSYAYAKLKLNLTSAGFYNWESDVFVGVTLTVYGRNCSTGKSAACVVTDRNTTITINVKVDGEIDYSTNPPSVNGTPYGALVAKGWVRIYYPGSDAQGRYTGAWYPARIVDVTYLGYGNYSITFEPRIRPIEDPIKRSENYTPIMVVVSDERGILVEGSTYNFILFTIERSTPNTLYYYDKESNLVTLARPSDISNEVYTLEMSANLSFFWLDQKLRVDTNLRLPPFPVMPIKQIRVNVSSDGAPATLRERPIQYEFWAVVNWYGRLINWPVGLADPQMDFMKEVVDSMTGGRYIPRLVFQVQFPTTSVRRQYVLLWWHDDLDAEPAACPTQIKYVRSLTHKDLWHPLYNLELVDIEHPQSRGYRNYRGVAALVLRDPYTDEALGPYNLHMFDKYGSYLGRYRPYGNWTVYYNYMRYSWIQAPIRIFAVLNTTRVGNVYTSGDVRSDYYSTLAIVQVINGTRYIPVITHVYWTRSRSGYGYWMATEMGKGIADQFLYLTAGNLTIGRDRRENWTYSSPFEWSSTPSVECFPDPGIMIAHWSASRNIGRAVILSRSGVTVLHSVGGTYVRFCVTKYAPREDEEQMPRQGSIEYVFWEDDVSRSVSSGQFVSFWAVILDYKISGSGFRSETATTMWRNAYIYAPMFLEKYAPVVRPP